MHTALVTGANRGIGLELCRALAARGDEVIAICRTASSELEKLKVRVESGIDLTAEQAPAEVVRRVGETKLDLVIQNAGILRPDFVDALSADSIRQQFETNTLAPLRLTAALVPRLPRGAKIALITSLMGSIADNGSGGMYGYRMSKAALNMAGVSLARDLKGRGIAVAILHPGFVRTEMTGGNGTLEPADSARGLLDRIDELTLETSGGFWHSSGKSLPW